MKTNKTLFYLMLAINVFTVSDLYAQHSDQVFLEYIPSQFGNSVGTSLRGGYELGLKQKELGSKVLNQSIFFIRNHIGVMQMNKENNNLSLHTIVGFRFYNQKTKISFEPLNLGVGFSYSKFKSTAFEFKEGTFDQLIIRDRNHALTLHMQVFAIGYKLPFKNLDVNLRFAPELIAYRNLQKTGESLSGSPIRIPILYYYLPVSLNLKF